MSELALSPTDFLKYGLDPVSKVIDANGGPHLLVGIIASGGEPHIYVTGNCKDSLQREICLALADKLREMAGSPSKPTLII